MKKVILCTVSLFLLLLITGIANAAAPVIFFSDMTDGPTTGFDGSSTKGAAISIWGLNLGGSRGSSTLTVGGVTLSSASDFAEWGATLNPTTARGLQRVTFYLNSSMLTSGTAPNTNIKVTVGGVVSNTIPFHARALGANHIYFVSPSGNDSNNGTSTTSQWKTGAKVRGTVIAGDTVYFRAGTYVSADTADWGSNQSFILFRNNHQNGTLGKSITLASYPGEMAQIGDGEISAATMTQFLKILPSGGVYDQVNYWTFSKFYGNLHDTMTTYYNTVNSSPYDNCRFVGMEINSSYSTSGTGIGFTFGAANSTKLLGNYFHHMGMGNAPPAPTVGAGVGTGLTGDYRAIVTYSVSATAGNRTNVSTETLPSPASSVQTLSNGALRISWTGVINTSPTLYNTVTIWRTKAGGNIFYLDKSVAASGAAGSIDTATSDGSLTQALDYNGFNADTYYRAGMPWYFGGYGIENDIEIAYNEAAYNYSGAQFYGHTTSDYIDNLHIHSNYFHDNYRRGITVGGGDGGAYTFVKNAYIYNNVFANNESAIKLNGGTSGDGGNYSIFNNTFYKNQRYLGDADLWLIGVSGGTMTLKNNIIVSSPLNTFGAYITTHQGNLTGVSGDHNLWIGGGTKPAWSTAGDINNTDPQFLLSNPSSILDFQLNATSPAVNTGANTGPLVIKDIFGLSRPADSVYDMGAYEYSTGALIKRPMPPVLKSIQ